MPPPTKRSKSASAASVLWATDNPTPTPAAVKALIEELGHEAVIEHPDPVSSLALARKCCANSMTVQAIHMTLLGLGIAFDQKARKTSLVPLLLNAGPSISSERGSTDYRGDSDGNAGGSGGVDDRANPLLSNTMGLPPPSVAAGATVPTVTNEGAREMVQGIGGGNPYREVSLIGYWIGLCLAEAPSQLTVWRCHQTHSFKSGHKKGFGKYNLVADGQPSENAGDDGNVTIGGRFYSLLQSLS